ncbi:DUF309 domain-containing protein [Singulisphaera acidiphila]|uniref:DUF309 domain-containing protein n=1 Tax=Singulisphaera acidiphila (strain ATCC BAA-1392 / DSM 18658 / VKM B-2454 / MOB10) TaxID=886293 RepID=L0DJ85_SINAD|nr:DUF309 domain-containing protein [Singulisphaera acidiphila]AGA29337.1 protein of unknown function (DUF309) [Singulisphaera acidiphila DSM 18658]
MDASANKDFPPYAYVPKGPWPHPTSSPQGHSAGRGHQPEPPIVADAWDRSPAYLRGFALFNAGYYWEAHETWEGLWHAHGRKGTTADILRALIKLAAAGVKVRERQPGGVVTHAQRAAVLFRSAHTLAGQNQLGLDLGELEQTAQQIADDPPSDSGSRDDPVVRVFTFRIAPQSPRPPSGLCPAG